MPYAQTNLPPPLSTTENYQLLKLLQADPEDDEVRGKLIEGNIRLVIHIANKFFNIGTVDELTSIGTIGLIKAANSFNLDKKVKFATYASTCITNEILMYARKTKKDRVVTSLDTVLSSDMDGGELTLMDVLSDDRVGEFSDSFIEQDNIDDMKEAIAKLPEREQELLNLYYHSDLTQKEVSERLGFSQSYMSRLLNKSLKRVRLLVDKKYKGDIVTVQAVSRATRIREEKKMSKDNKIKSVYRNVEVKTIAEQKAVDLLKDTRDNYKDISAKTGVSYARVVTLGKDSRSESLRKELKAEQVRLNRLKANNSNSKVNKSTNIVAHQPELTKTPSDTLGKSISHKVEEPTPTSEYKSIFVNKEDVTPDMKVASFSPQLYKMMEENLARSSSGSIQPVSSAVEEVNINQVADAVKAKVFEGSSDVPVAPIKGVIKRSCFIDAATRGEAVSVKDFLDELKRVGAVVDPDIDAEVTFEIKIKAVQK